MLSQPIAFASAVVAVGLDPRHQELASQVIEGALEPWQVPAEYRRKVGDVITSRAQADVLEAEEQVDPIDPFFDEKLQEASRRRELAAALQVQ